MTSLAEVVAAEALAPRDRGRWAALGTPEAVVRPADAQEAAAILAWASREGVGVVPVGSGERLGVRSVAARFVVMTTERLSGIEIYEPADVTFTAKAGTRVGDVAAELAGHGQWLPFDPPHFARRTLGGLVADGDTGPLQAGYGSLRNHVLGMTVVTGDGRVLRLGGRVVKNVAGFDLLKPMVGSRGRLAFVTSVCLRAFPRPVVDLVLVKSGASISQLAEVARDVTTAPVVPASCVLAAGAVSPEGVPVLAVRLHGSEQTVAADRRAIESSLGEPLEVSGSGPAAIEADRLADAETLLAASVLPSRLPAALAALETLEPRGVRVDACGAYLAVALDGWPAERVCAWRDRLTELGGALSVRRAPTDVDVLGVDTGCDGAELRLASRLASVLDPEGVLWVSEH